MGKHFTEYIDLTSFANQWMIYELNMEISVNSSVYFYKDTDAHGDGKLHASWPWDMEHSIHVAEYAQQSWFATADTNPADYWIWLYRHPEFGEAVQNQWQKVFVPALNQILAEQKTEDPHDLYKAQRIFKPCIARISVAICLLLSEGWHIIGRDL